MHHASWRAAAVLSGAIAQVGAMQPRRQPAGDGQADVLRLRGSGQRAAPTFRSAAEPCRHLVMCLVVAAAQQARGLLTCAGSAVLYDTRRAASLGQELGSGGAAALLACGSAATPHTGRSLAPLAPLEGVAACSASAGPSLPRRHGLRGGQCASIVGNAAVPRRRMVNAEFRAIGRAFLSSVPRVAGSRAL